MLSIVTEFLNNRSLIYHLTKRKILAQYKGSFLGMFWTVFEPFLMLMVYTFVFTVVFEARWGKKLDNRFDYALLLFTGMIVHGFLARSLNLSPMQMKGNITLVKRVVFPVEVLPWVTIGTVLFQSSINFLVLLGFHVILNRTLSWTIILLPLVFLPYILFTVGCAWFLSAAGIYIKDLAQSVAILTLALMFLAPIFYPLQSVPHQFRQFIMFNPVTFIVEQARAVLIYGSLPDWKNLGIYSIISVVVCWLGHAFFQRLRPGFADVL